MGNILMAKRGATGLTGRNLRAALQGRGIRIRATPIESERGNYKLIRWGNSESVRFSPRQGIINEKGAIESNANKLNALRIMRSAGVSIPPFETVKANAHRNIRFPLIGRTTNHQGGSGLTIVNNRRELRNDNRSTHWMEQIDIEREYRVHVINETVIGVQKKVENPDFEGTPNTEIRNLANGWRFSLRDIGRVADDIKEAGLNAVTALGLDFGAADIVIDSDRNIYVLEVNSAPALEPESTLFNIYVDRFVVFYRGVEPEIPSSPETSSEEEEVDEEEEVEFSDSVQTPERVRRAQSRVSISNSSSPDPRAPPTPQEEVAILLERAAQILRNTQR